MLSASNSKDRNDERVDEGPDESGHGVEVVSEELHAETGGVVDCDVVAEHGENEQDEAELGEWEGMEGLSEEAAKPVVGIGF